MYPDLYKEAHSIWQKLSAASPIPALQFELEVYQRLLNFFMVGDYYYYIFNLTKAEFELVSEEMTRVLGYDRADMTVAFFVSLIHPEDQPWFLNFEQKVSDFFCKLPSEKIPRYKVRYDYRVRRKSGEYIRILQQVITIQTSEGQPVMRTLGVHTDISHLQQEGKPVLSFIGQEGEPSYLNVAVKNYFAGEQSAFTKRESEILQLLAAGKSSEVIAQALFISKQTVDTHRKNMLKKTGCTNTSELISVAIRKGWL